MKNNIKETLELQKQYDEYCADLSIPAEDILGYSDWIAEQYAKENKLIRLVHLDASAN